MLNNKWYKFLIYFALWAMAFINIAIGIIFISGTHYKLLSLTKNVVYSYYLDLQKVDKFLGYVHILISIYIINVFYNLFGLKKGSLNMLLAMHVIIIFFRVLYFIVCPLNLQAFKLYNILSLIINILLIIFNYCYLRKCRQTFIN